MYSPYKEDCIDGGCYGRKPIEDEFIENYTDGDCKYWANDFPGIIDIDSLVDFGESAEVHMYIQFVGVIIDVCQGGDGQFSDGDWKFVRHVDVDVSYDDTFTKRDIFDAEIEIDF